MSLLPSKQAQSDPVAMSGQSSQGRHLSDLIRNVRLAVLPLITLAAVGIAWEVTVRLSGVAEYLVPTPSAVGSRLFGDIGYFLFHGLITLIEALGGFAMGTLIALVAAVVMAHSRLFERTVYPLALLIKVTPIVAVAPLFVIWFGFGSFPKMMIAALITFFPVMVNTFIGLRSVNPTTLDFFRLLDKTDQNGMAGLRHQLPKRLVELVDLGFFNGGLCVFAKVAELPAASEVMQKHLNAPHRPTLTQVWHKTGHFCTPMVGHFSAPVDNLTAICGRPLRYRRASQLAQAGQLTSLTK